MEKVEIVIIGAGIIGLSIAKELSGLYEDILVLEKNPSFGQETSSRNSEVIHAGIYYPKNSLKAEACLEGKELLYQYCEKNNIAHKKIGKLIVAETKNEIKGLEELFKNALANGVKDLKIISKDEIRKIEPHIKAELAIYSGSTGILDSHSLMKSLAAKAKSCRAEIAYDTEMVGVDKCKEGFKIFVKDKKAEGFTFLSRVVINCAGLDSETVAKMVGLEKADYRLKYCKGDYFRVHNNKAKFIRRLIYPLVSKNSAGLGIHATLDLSGGLRLGPDDEYIENINYDIDESKRNAFYESVRQFLPFINLEDLGPDTSGIRPKLQGPGESFRDFLIKDESDSGLKGFVNLAGIESPGLTACLSIAKKVRAMVKSLT
ncbi:MAG: NAD(P)/FAD-dependent oxidoreductase [Candidatus Omnitrophica bacterium]|nr:NAD(P)/FAD-dependent oxidoreductase [Candidatus Omnitrophota bacterium]MDD5429556.1 NAD(P)/FAD-dependent oxidoreductase [Candidatus Omnitrophota bacterium]